MQETNYKSVIESILFASGDSVSAKKISQVLDLPLNWTKEIIRDLMLQYNTPERGIHIIEANECYQLVSNRENAFFLELMFKTSKTRGLTHSGLEVLAIIAYKQPITKGEIDYIRGVKSDKAIQSLIDRQLIVEKGRLEKIGKPIIYGTTESFLKTFNFKSLKELPEITQFENFHLFDVLEVAEEDDEEVNPND
jgi:segregation and condensation protein B